jgi:hypothetical protein
VRAKSDWYWAIGANSQVASALGSSDTEAEDDHELVAALYCLAVAHQLVGSAKDGSRAVLLGDRAGVYATPAAVDHTWVDSVGQVGVLARTLKAREGRSDEQLVRLAKAVDVGVLDAEEQPLGVSTDTSTDTGDELDLYLQDNGGVWAKIARRHGFRGQHLSGDHPVLIRVRLKS